MRSINGVSPLINSALPEALFINRSLPFTNGIFPSKKKGLPFVAPHKRSFAKQVLVPLATARERERAQRLPKGSSTKTSGGTTRGFFFFTLLTGSNSLILELSDTRVYEPQIRARLVTTEKFSTLDGFWHSRTGANL